MTSDGFIVGHRVIYAAEYSLAGGATLIVWFDRDGNDANGHNFHSDAKRRIVTAKPGETILHKGEPRVIEAVRPYRESGYGSALMHSSPSNSNSPRANVGRHIEPGSVFVERLGQPLPVATLCLSGEEKHRIFLYSSRQECSGRTK